MGVCGVAIDNLFDSAFALLRSTNEIRWPSFRVIQKIEEIFGRRRSQSGRREKSWVESVGTGWRDHRQVNTRSWQDESNSGRFRASLAKRLLQGRCQNRLLVMPKVFLS